jgi:hypothetical protein
MIDQDPDEQEKSRRYICGYILLGLLVYKCKLKNKNSFFTIIKINLKKKNNRMYRVIKIRIEIIIIYVLRKRNENEFIMKIYHIRIHIHTYNVCIHGKTL